MNVFGNYEKYHGKFEIVLNRERLSYVVRIIFSSQMYIFLSYSYSKIKIPDIPIN